MNVAADGTVARVLASEEVDSSWLTACLQRAGHDAVVTSFEQAPIGTGQIGKCLRYQLQYSRNDSGAPATLVGKFAADDADSRMAGVQFGNFIKEVSFYQSLQSRLSISTPRCYYADIDGEGPGMALLLEDLAPMVQGDQLQGTDARVARSAVAQLVGLHAPTWCDESLRGIDWLGEPAAETGSELKALYASLVPGFLERFAAELEPDEAAIIQRVGEADGPLFSGLSDPFSIVHVDFRLDNLMIEDAAGEPAVTVIDWQSLTLGHPLSDVAYFIGAGLRRDERRRVERGLVEHYHKGLLAAGVAGYDWQRCWQDYARGSFAGFGVTVIASMLVQRTQRGDEMFATMARRHARHALDLGADDYLS
ncbi:MAG: phosphotransferase [Pseudomonadaceae bacterium]|nr:phosphotransferase [Pseudomonadaceae bacterium]